MGERKHVGAFIVSFCGQLFDIDAPLVPDAQVFVLALRSIGLGHEEDEPVARPMMNTMSRLFSRGQSDAARPSASESEDLM